MIARLAPLAMLLLAACAEPPARAPEEARPAGPAPPAIEVAVTIDDLPVHGPDTRGMDRLAIVDRLLAAFAKHRLPPVYGFVNGKKVDEAPGTEEVLRRWIAAGNPLGNHTYAHPSLHATALADYLADIERGELVLKKLGADPASWKVFRYPFLFEGDTMDKREAVRAWLREHGYRIAHVTIDADDWAYNAPFSRCTERGDAAALATLRRTFVAGHLDELARMRALTRAIAQREVPQVLLLHIGAADADAIDELLTAYEAEGVRFVSLDRALADPFYAIDPALPARAGAALPYRIAKARGVPRPEPIFARGLEEKLDAMCR